MVERLKWELEMTNGNLAEAGENIRRTIHDMCSGDALTVHFHRSTQHVTRACLL